MLSPLQPGRTRSATKASWRHATAVHREQRRPAIARNDIWSIDFVTDQLADGRRFRALTTLDLFTRECLAIYVGQGLSRRDVVATQERLRFERGSATTLLLRQRHRVRRCRDGPVGVYQRRDTDLSRLGKPTDNAAIEPFKGQFREECLNVPSSRRSRTRHRRSTRFGGTTMSIILTALSRPKAVGYSP